VRAGWLAGVVVAVVIGAGCTGEDAAVDAAPSTTASLSSPVPSSVVPSSEPAPSSASATFVPVAPQEPPPMPVPEQTPEGAVAFLEWWIAVLNYAELTGETDVLRANSVPECVFCAGQIDNIESTYEAGLRIERSGDTTFSDFQPSPVDLDGSVLVQLIGQSPPARRLETSGNVVESSAGVGPAAYTVSVRWIEETWKFRGLADDT